MVDGIGAAHGDDLAREQIRYLVVIVGFVQLVEGDLHLAEAVVLRLVVSQHDDHAAVGIAAVVLQDGKSLGLDLGDVGIAVAQRPVGKKVGVVTTDGDHLLHVLEEQGLTVLGAYGGVIHADIVQHGLVVHGHAELVAHVPQGDIGGVNGGVADLQAVAVDVSCLVIVVGDAVGVVAEHTRAATVVLQILATQAATRAGGVHDIQIAVHEEVDGILVELAAGHGVVEQDAVLLAVKDVLALASVLGHDDGVEALLIQPLADLGVDRVARGKGLAVTAVAVGPRLFDVGTLSNYI